MKSGREDTGRIRRTLSRSALEALHGNTIHRTRASELALLVKVDRAHLVMLVQAGLLERMPAARLLGAIRELEAGAFAPLLNVAAPRGLYLLYESYLIDQLGEEMGGVLHTARSRNDLNATIACLGIREPLVALLRELLRCVTVLLASARRHAGTVMPIYTHFQPALAGSYGHYLAAVAQPLQRSAGAILDCSRYAFEVCPLGAGAAMGTTLPIRPDITARLLGFAVSARNSLDAVASRDVIVRVLCEAATLGITLSRLAVDLQLWTSLEFGFLRLPDSLVGSSSMMPQKRNPYLLEHVQGRSARPLGALVAAVTAMHAKPFTNNIAAGSEALTGLEDSLASIRTALVLARVIIMGARPQPAAMRQRAEASFLEATEIANRLVLAGLPFRRAHHLVGKAITEALESDASDPEASAAAYAGQIAEHIDLHDLDPETLMRGSQYGGGPGALIREGALDAERSLLRSYSEELKRQVACWRQAEDDLAAEVERLCARHE